MSSYGTSVSESQPRSLAHSPEIAVDALKSDESKVNFLSDFSAKQGQKEHGISLFSMLLILKLWSQFVLSVSQGTYWMRHPTENFCLRTESRKASLLVIKDFLRPQPMII